MGRDVEILPEYPDIVPKLGFETAEEYDEYIATLEAETADMKEWPDI